MSHAKVVARRRLAGVIAFVASGALVAVAQPVSAEPAPPSGAAQRDEAKAAFGRGNAAYNLGKYAEAIAEFEKAYALSRLPEILFNLGQSYRKRWEAERRSELGRRALHYYEALLREAPSSKVRPDAEQFIRELAPAVAAKEAEERQGLIAGARGAEALELARSFFVNGQLQDAAGILDRLLREPDHGRELLAEGYLLRGRVAAGQGDVLGAEAHFKKALALRPQAEIVEPRGQEPAAFEAAKRSAGKDGLRLVQAPLGEAQPGRPVRIEVRIEGDTEKMVAALELGYRPAGGAAFLTERTKVPAVPTLPGVALPAGAKVDYYVRALNEHGSVLAESGTPTLPFRLQVASPPVLVGGPGAGPPPWYKRWWVWTLAGAVAVGAGGATYAATRGGDDTLVISAGTNE